MSHQRNAATQLPKGVLGKLLGNVDPYALQESGNGEAASAAGAGAWGSYRTLEKL